MARPRICGRCAADLDAVPGHDERYESDFRCWVGFLECAECGAAYIYQREDKRQRQLRLPRAPVQLRLF